MNQSRTSRDCDCLNVCGDDPGLHDGRCEPCQARKDIVAHQKAEAIRKANLNALPGKVQPALQAAEGFIAGFEDDDTQEGIADMLAAIREAVAAAKVLTNE